MVTPLSVNADRGDDGGPLVVVKGEIDLSNVETFIQALTAAIAGAGEAGGTVTLDLSAVEYLDSAAIGALSVHAGERPAMRVIANPYLLPVLTISGIDQLVTVEPAKPGAR